MRANIKITLTVKSPHREDHRDTQKLYHKIYLKKDLIKLVAEIYEDDFDVFTLSSSRISSRIYQIFLIFQIFKVSDLYSLSNLRHAFRESRFQFAEDDFICLCCKCHFWAIAEFPDVKEIENENDFYHG